MRQHRRFRFLGKNDRVCVSAFDDPKVPGVACHISQARTGGVKGTFGLAEDPSRFRSPAARPGRFPADVASLPARRVVVYSERTSVFFKHTQVYRHRRQTAEQRWSTSRSATRSSRARRKTRSRPSRSCPGGIEALALCRGRTRHLIEHEPGAYHRRRAGGQRGGVAVGARRRAGGAARDAAGARTEAHHGAGLAELVCSNSFRSDDAQNERGRPVARGDAALRLADPARRRRAQGAGGRRAGGRPRRAFPRRSKRRWLPSRWSRSAARRSRGCRRPSGTRSSSPPAR